VGGIVHLDELRVINEKAGRPQVCRYVSTTPFQFGRKPPIKYQRARRLQAL